LTKRVNGRQSSYGHPAGRHRHPPQELADQDAVLWHALRGEPLDPEVSRRLRDRAARVTEEVRRLHGDLDNAAIDELFRDDPDEL
jgi:hypothetical protein